LKLIALICFIGGLVALLAIVTVWIVTARQRRRPSRRIDASWSRRQKQLRRRIHWCQGATVLASSFVVLALLGVIMTAADDSAAQSTSSLALSRARRDARSRAKSESKTDRNSRSSASKSGNSLLPSSSSSSSFPSSSSSAHRHLLLRRQLHRLRRLRQAAVNQRPRRL
jgi:ABC-type Fe3+ transport system permease subunit